MVAEVASISSQSAVAGLGVQPLQKPIVMRRRRQQQPPPPPTATQKLCGPCHYSCLKCRAPNDYDCIACAPDAQLTERTSNESYCLSIGSKTPSTTKAPDPTLAFANDGDVPDSDTTTTFNTTPLAVAAAVKIVIGIAIVATIFEILRKCTNVFSCWRSPGSAAPTTKPFEAYAYGKAAVHDDDDDDDDEADEDEEDIIVVTPAASSNANSFASDSEIEIPLQKT